MSTRARQPVSKLQSVLGCVAWVGLSLGAGILGAVGSGPDAWYQSLDKPPWTPPSWLFGPVWTTLYILMGIAAWLVWEQRHTTRVQSALGLYLGQLALNAAWSWLFFGLHRPGLAFAELMVLWVAILVTLLVFGRIRRVAALLLLPYLAWVTFAGALNGSIWLRNLGG